MSYVVLARKWRPQSFEDLVGQEHVARTLENAIKQNRVAHAFLFTGVRGVGKTTSARILAKALNCAKGPTSTPCLECDPCREIAAGSDVDVQEIDGASYNGVDEVRRLQETLPYRPTRDRFKIFIVDEVHMLSNAAWNAFLKTLEEPPPHVKFIFATTEVHKVPVTILSRCQRYDFKLITAQSIGARLRHVLEQEGIGADDASIGIVAREAAGSMRDAMSLLDQVIAWAGGDAGDLTADSVAKVLGVAERAVLHELSQRLIEGDASGCLAVIAKLAEGGYDLVHVARDVLSSLRDLVVARVSRDPAALLDLPDADVAAVKELAATTTADDLTRLHQGFSKAFDDIAKSGQPRAALEMTLVRLARRPPLLPMDELLRRLGELERRLGGAAPGGAATPTPGGPPAGARGGRGVGATAGGRPAAPREPGRERRTAAGDESDATADPPTRSPSPPAPPPPASPPPAPPPPATGPPTLRQAARPASAEPGEVPAATFEGSELLAGWRDVVDVVREERAALASVLEHAAVLALSPERVVLGYPEGSFLLAQVEEKAARATLSKALGAALGGAPVLEVRVLEKDARHRTLADVSLKERKAKVEAARAAVEKHPLVGAAVELLGAELREVRLPAELADSVTGR